MKKEERKGAGLAEEPLDPWLLLLDPHSRCRARVYLAPNSMCSQDILTNYITELS